MTPASPTKVAVVVLNYNGLEDTLACLRSLLAVEWEWLRLILVDNASAVDPEPPARVVAPAIDYERTDRNLGYAGGNNRGIERALAWGADYVLVLNNDTVVAPGIVSTLVAAFEQHPTVGILGPVVNFLDEPATVMTDGVSFNTGPGTEFFPRVMVPVRADSLSVVPVDIVNGCCMMFRSEVLRTIGLFDEAFFIVHEESDLCLRAWRAGYGCAVLGRTLVWHKGSSAFERSGRQLQRYYDARNLYHLLTRHAGALAGARSRAVSRWHYWRYAFFRYVVEREADKTAAAAAVVRGAWDGWRGVTGPVRDLATPSATFLRWLFAGGYHLSLLKRRFRA